MTLEYHIENVISVGAGITLGMTKTVDLLPNASESINTFFLALLGGIGGYLGKELIRVAFVYFKKKWKK